MMWPATFTPLLRVGSFGRWRLALGSCLFAPLLLVGLIAVGTPPTLRAQDSNVKRITWADVAPLHSRLASHGITDRSFDAYVERTRKDSARRVTEGDLDHLVFYFLQSTRFTNLPPIEPALSAKSLVASLEAEERKAFLSGSPIGSMRAPLAVKARLAAFLRALESKRDDDPRLAYFRGLVNATVAMTGQREARLLDEYLRAMRFVYQKEFVAQKSERPAEAIADLYRTRGLSTDTAVEAGYLVHDGLGIAKSLEPERRIRRVLIVGPGLDLAPRTALLDDRPPESYQPWAVIDALLGLKLSRADDLDVVAADINPRVVEHLRRSRQEPPALTVVSEIRDSDAITLSGDYREYFNELGRQIGQVDGKVPARTPAGHLRKHVKVSPAIARTLSAVALDVVTERIDGPGFDLVIATNILPYFDDVQLALAVTNIAAMTVPGGFFLHNEARPVLGELTAAAGLPFEQSRHAVIAAVKGAATPLFDSVWLHRKPGR